MSIARTVINIAKARLLARIFGRTLGGPVATGLMAAYLGRKAWKQMQARRARRLAG